MKQKLISKLKTILAMTLVLAMLATSGVLPAGSVAEAADTETKKTDFDLQFDANGSFTILQIADLQNHYPIKSKELDVVARAVKQYQPDLIVMSGDNVFQPSSSTFKDTVTKIVECFDGTPFAVIFGNHDSEENPDDDTRMTRQEEYDIYKELGAVDFDNNFSETDLSGVGTGNIPIRSSDGKSVAYNIVLFDTGTYADAGGYGKAGYNEVSPYDSEEGYQGVVSWFTQMNEAMKSYSDDEGYVPTLAFQHIPLQEIYTSGILVEADENTTGAVKSSAKTASLNVSGKYYVKGTDVTGDLNEAPSCSCADTSAMYKALAGPGNVKAIFYGHDHMNDFVGTGTVTYDGAEYTLTQGYTPSATDSDYKKDGTQYVRVFELKEDGTYETKSVKREDMDPVPASAPEYVTDDATYEAYDVVEYANLNIDNSAIWTGTTKLSGNSVFTYDKQSKTGSAIFKFGWTPGKNDSSLMLSFDKPSDDIINYMFGAWLHNGENVTLGNGMSVDVNLTDSIQAGTTYNIEFARLKVKTGENAGKYHVYFKMDGKLIAESYIEADVVDANGTYTEKRDNLSCTISNEILFNDWGELASSIGATVEKLTEDFDTVTFADLQNLTKTDSVYNVTKTSYGYEGTSSSYSVVFKFGWTPDYETGDKQLMMAVGGEGWDYDCYTWFQSDKTQFLNVDNYKSSTGVEAGKKHNVEMGRLYVEEGTHQGEYYQYLEIDGEIWSEGYKGLNSATTDKAACYKISFDNTCGSFSDFGEVAEPEQEAYAPYDTITLADLAVKNSASGVYANPDTKNYSDRTDKSETHSVEVQFGWEVDTTTPSGNTLLMMGLDGEYNVDGCYAWFEKDQTRLFLNGTTVSKDPITNGMHDIEFGRLRVTAGEHVNQEYAYIKIDGEIFAETYAACLESLQYTVYVDSVGAGQRFYEFGEELTTDYDNMTLADLGITGTDWESAVPAGTYDYSGKENKSATHSLIFSFGWEPCNPRDDWMLNLDGSYAYSSTAWFQQEATNLYVSDVANISGSVVESGRHNVEFARLYVTAGPNQGKYYEYVKVDNSIAVSGYFDLNAKTLDYKICFDGVIADEKFSGFAEPEGYEAYDIVEYSDLKYNGETLGETATLNNQSALFTYDRTSPTGSAIVKFRWKVGTASSFMMSFEHTKNTEQDSNEMAYTFGTWLKDAGTMELINGTLSKTLNTSDECDIEFARLKVKNGPNEGKYKLYIKMSDETGELLYAEKYVDANVVDSEGNYTTDPFDTNCNVLSGEIFLAFYSSYANIISAYGGHDPITHTGIRGDFDGDGTLTIDTVSIASLIDILLGEGNPSDAQIEKADFNHVGGTNSADLVAMIKESSDVNTYTRDEALGYGIQEHLGADQYKTVEYIADACEALGVDSYRLSVPIGDLFEATLTNDVQVNAAKMDELKAMVAALKAKGITEILYVSNIFILPYGYAYAGHEAHGRTVPNPTTEYDYYIAWLRVNAAAFKKLAEEIPEIRYFEPYNEINVGSNRLAPFGVDWNSIDASTAYSTQVSAGILADICWNVTDAVKSVNSANQVTTPSLGVEDVDAVDLNFLDAFYTCIESGTYPRNKTLGDKRVDNYFTIINVHNYPGYDKAEFWERQDNLNNQVANTWATEISNAYNVVKKHNDGNSPVWLTETGEYSKNNDGTMRDETIQDDIMSLMLGKFDSDLNFIDAVFFYEIADNAVANPGYNNAESTYGFFKAPDASSGAYSAKKIAYTVYKYFHNGSTDYTSIDGFVSKYQS